MADVDIMDLFDKDFIAPEESSQLRSSGIQDYKPSRTYQSSSRPKPLETSTQKRVEEDKKSLASSSDIDEKLVWVGAIFVFFGVFAFLLGYWLGNIKEKEITQVQKEKQALLAEKIEEQKTEIALKQQSLPVQQAQEVVQQTPVASSTPSPVAEVPVIPSLTENTSPKPSQQKTEAKPKVSSPSENKATKPVSTPSVQGRTSGVGSFTIQVSAHTSLEKAQAVENQLRQAGFSPYIVETTINETTYYRVRVGSYGSKTEAESALARLKQSPVGKDAYVLSLK
ncbi:MAG: SPOR domain-containing protein [Brevinematales bacterium]|jgi:cell division septation protein DedD|nr:SPOR domain-containing protein [Brevinematales bacterium]